MTDGPVSPFVEDEELDAEASVRPRRLACRAREAAEGGLRIALRAAALDGHQHRPLERRRPHLHPLPRLLLPRLPLPAGQASSSAPSPARPARTMPGRRFRAASNTSRRSPTASPRRRWAARRSIVSAPVGRARRTFAAGCGSLGNPASSSTEPKSRRQEIRGTLSAWPSG